MADRVTISNQALSLLGEDDQMIDPDEDTHAARTIRAVWDVVRKATLREGEFNFSIVRASLSSNAALTADDLYPYSFGFPLPDGFQRLVEVLDPPSIRGAYEIEKVGLVANTNGPVRIRYVEDVPETGRWDGSFVNAFAHRLAYQICERITGDRSRKNDCWAGYRAAIGKAIGVDAVENPPVETVEDDWITARWSGTPEVP
jgi:hypothetical protein